MTKKSSSMIKKFLSSALSFINTTTFSQDLSVKGLKNFWSLTYVKTFNMHSLYVYIYKFYEYTTVLLYALKQKI